MTVIAPAGVEAMVAQVGLALGNQGRRQDEDEHAHGDVDPEDPRPAEVLGQDSAEEHTGRRAGAAERAPDPERLVPLRAFLEGGGHDRERRRRDDRCAEALDCARADQDAGAVGEAANERGEREQRQADQEDPFAPEQVGHPPAEQEEAAERDRVGGDHPLHRLLLDVEVDLDRRDRDVDDRDVEDGHEERGAHDCEGQPAAVGCLGGHLAPSVAAVANDERRRRISRARGPGRRRFAARVTPFHIRDKGITHPCARPEYARCGGKGRGVPRGNDRVDAERRLDFEDDHPVPGVRGARVMSRGPQPGRS